MVIVQLCRWKFSHKETMEQLCRWKFSHKETMEIAFYSQKTKIAF